jgi:mono/diheme cytochrome c family protein
MTTTIKATTKTGQRMTSDFLSRLVLSGGSALALLMSMLMAVSAQELSFSQAQVDTGKALYKEVCQICHGSTLANGQFGTPLKGSFFQDKWKDKSVGELVAFVYEKMPPDKTMSLTEAQYLGAVAYILSRNDIAVSDKDMRADKKALQAAMLPW